MQLEIPNAADMFGVGFTVGSRGKRTVGSDPCHPFIDTAVNLKLN